jgi:hypothetical protein
MIQVQDILRPGITGYLSSGKEPVRDRVNEADVKHWLSACHAAARRLKAHLQPLRAIEPGRNFYTLAIDSHSTGPFFILLHAVLPYTGAVRLAEWTHHEEYLDLPLRAADLGERFTILPKDLLDAPFAFEHWMRDALGPAALNDIKRSKPRRVGDLVFNYYD